MTNPPHEQRAQKPTIRSYFDRIDMIFRMLITSFHYPVNPVDPVRVLRSDGVMGDVLHIYTFEAKI